MHFRCLSFLFFTGLLVSGCSGSNDDPLPRPGDLDLSYNGDGKVVVAHQGNEVGRAADLQADGKLVIAGGAHAAAGDMAAMIVRLDAEGYPDSTFNGTGKLIFNPSSAQDQAFAVLVQADGRIVIAGEMYNGTGATLLVARFNEDGTPDTTFDSDGRVNVMVGGFATIARAIAQQADGKLVVAADVFNGSNSDFAVLRLKTDGSLDDDFGAGGLATTDFRDAHDQPFAIAVGADGVITVAGYSAGGFPSPHDAAVARFTSTGALDPAFDIDGKKIFSLGTGLSAFHDVVIQPDTRIVAVGDSIVGGLLSHTAVRFDSTGALDTGWGTAGVATYTAGTTHSSAFACALQADGKVLVAGYGYVGGREYFVLTRLSGSGMIDTEFGSAGQAFTEFGSGGECVRAVVIQNDDRIIAAGNSTSGFVAARYLP